jgi:hypothetical protein
VFAAAFAAALNLVPAIVHPVFAVSRLRPSALAIVTLHCYRASPTHGPIYAFIFLAGVYAVAWLERIALGTTRSTVLLFGISGTVLAVLRGIDAWQRRDRVDVELDELVELPTLRLGLME